MTTGVTLEELIGILTTALKSPATLRRQVVLFQETVWDSAELAVSKAQERVLRDLALDLSYFVANPADRKEDPAYFGPSRALDEIRNAVKALKAGEA